jgi:hypothetical protein
VSASLRDNANHEVLTVSCAADKFYTETEDVCMAGGATVDTDAVASCFDCQGASLCADGEFYTVADDACAAGGTAADTATATCGACSGNTVCGAGKFYTAADDICLAAGATVDSAADTACSSCQAGSETVCRAGRWRTL